MKKIAGEYTELAIKTLVSIMADPKAPHAARVAAASQLLDRGHGRPHQAQDITLNAKADSVNLDDPHIAISLAYRCLFLIGQGSRAVDQLEAAEGHHAEEVH